MQYTLRIQKGQLWRPEDLRGSSTQVSIRVTKGIGWVTSQSSREDVIYREGQSLDLNQRSLRILALSGDLDLEVYCFT